MANGEWTITIPQSEYDALRAVESNALALERLMRVFQILAGKEV